MKAAGPLALDDLHDPGPLGIGQASPRLGDAAELGVVLV
jgi:hypothetical protein